MLALEFVSTVRATRSGPLDTLSDVADMTGWGRAHAAELGLATDFTATEDLWREVIELRQAVRALFARAVAPGPVSSADADRLPGAAASLDLVNAAALAVPRAPRLEWPDGGEPVATDVPAGRAGESARIRAALAASAIELLAGPERGQLHACPAPRCVLYFVKEHPRQEWCSVGCGNRARAARHYHQHKGR
ncbi:MULTISPECIES: CGNR zinc finger domain-containing protein [Streptosporangium]|uniref:RNA-binding Zn ribbon-like protein n=1 Tax=Streptosporangium brasiliense TaxID=47480 RepID=A0ABT9R251_9ACTN|nr:ABATE domain-containing protein [Streptosporangium brasiliense]MDP9862942.1 putative RNA-binding Zn ribbon-like protein [Streptosporangium brasiliense]